MKKVLFTIITFLVFTTFVNAECTYTNKKDYNTLASYVDYVYDYNFSNDTFKVTIYNMVDDFSVDTTASYHYERKDIVIDNVKSGSTVKVTIVVSSDPCMGEKLRVLNVKVPYINSFYGSSSCQGYENLSVCSSKFLDYQINESNFYSIINSSKIDHNKKEEEKKEEPEVSLLEKAVEFLMNIYIPVIVVIISSLITFLILRPIYRKIEHGI